MKGNKGGYLFNFLVIHTSRHTSYSTSDQNNQMPTLAPKFTKYQNRQPFNFANQDTLSN